VDRVPTSSLRFSVIAGNEHKEALHSMNTLLSSFDMMKNSIAIVASH